MDFTKVSEFLDRITQWRIPGCSCVVYYKNEEVYKYSAGYADVENRVKMDCDYHKMFMYSCSKPVTCAAALRLWEEGKFLLTDALCDYMPAWNDVKVKAKNEKGEDIVVPAKRKITIGDLFTMTSGIDYATGGDGFQGGLRDYAPKCSTVDMMNALAKDPIFCQPGEKWCYGMSHDILGALIEVITGMNLRDYAKKYIFDPLGMTDTEYTGSRIIEDKARAATEYYFDDERDGYFRVGGQDNCFVFGTEFFSGGAGILSTVTDMAKFANMMATGGKASDGTQIINKRTIDLMRSNRIAENQREGYWFPGYGYGLGVRTLVDPAAADSSSKVGEFGWTGAAGAIMIIDPDSEVAIYYAQHMMNNQEHYVGPRLRNTVYSCLE